MSTRKLKDALPVFVGGFLLTGLAAQEPKPSPKADPKTEVKPVNRMVLGLKGKVVMLDPDNPKDLKTLVEPGKDEELSNPTLSPDGKRLCYLADPKPTPGKEAEGLPRRVMLRDLGRKDPAELIAETSVGGIWGATADEILVFGAKQPVPGEEQQSFMAVAFNLATSKSVELTVPPAHLPFSFAPDGALITQKGGNVGWKPSLVTYRVSRDGKKVEPLTDPAYLAVNGDLSPDGKTMLFTGLKMPDDPKKLKNAPSRLYVQPVGGKVTELTGALLGEHLALKWSPDGKRIAYVWRQDHDKPAEEGKEDERETEMRLLVCDADGKNARTLISEKGKGHGTNVLNGLDWR